MGINLEAYLADITYTLERQERVHSETRYYGIAQVICNADKLDDWEITNYYPGVQGVTGEPRARQPVFRISLSTGIPGPPEGVRLFYKEIGNRELKYHDETGFFYEQISFKKDKNNRYVPADTAGYNHSGNLNLVCKMNGSEEKLVDIEGPNSLICRPSDQLTEKQYTTMLQELFDMHKNLILNANSWVVAKRSATQDASGGENAAAHLRLKATRQFLDEIEAALKSISHEPKSLLRKERRRVSAPEQIKGRIDGRTLAALASGATITVPVNVESYDIYEHRIIRQALENLESQIGDWEKSVEKDIDAELKTAKPAGSIIEKWRAEGPRYTKEKEYWAENSAVAVEKAYQRECSPKYNDRRQNPTPKNSAADEKIIYPVKYMKVSFFNAGSRHETRKYNSFFQLDVKGYYDKARRVQPVTLRLLFSTLSRVEAAREIVLKVSQTKVVRTKVVRTKVYQTKVYQTKEPIPITIQGRYLCSDKDILIFGDIESINDKPIDPKKQEEMEQGAYTDKVYEIMHEFNAEFGKAWKAVERISNGSSQYQSGLKCALENNMTQWSEQKTRLQKLLKHPLLSGLKTHREPLRPTPVFIQDARYQKAWIALQDVDKSLLIFDDFWSKSDSLSESFPVRYVHEIYEYWCFYKMLTLLIQRHKWELAEDGSLTDKFRQFMDRPNLNKRSSNRENIRGLALTLKRICHEKEITMKAFFDTTINDGLRPDYRFCIQDGGKTYNLYIDAKYMPYESARKHIKKTAVEKYLNKAKDGFEAKASFIVCPKVEEAYFGGGHGALVAGTGLEDDFHRHRVGIIPLAPPGNGDAESIANSERDFLLLMQMFLEYNYLLPYLVPKTEVVLETKVVLETEVMLETEVVPETENLRFCWKCGEEGKTTSERLYTESGYPKIHYHCSTCDDFWVVNHCRGNGNHPLIKHLSNFHIQKGEKPWFVVCPKCGNGAEPKLL